MELSPKELINSRGGYKAVSAALGWPKTTVHTWVRLDGMPKWRRPMIEMLPQKRAEDVAAPRPKKRAERRAEA